MNLRRTAETIATAIVTSGTDTATVANAAGVPVASLVEHLHTGELTMPEVVRVSGVLRLRPEDLFAGAAA